MILQQITGNREETQLMSTEGASLGWQVQAKLSGKRTRFLGILWKVSIPG